MGNLALGIPRLITPLVVLLLGLIGTLMPVEAVPAPTDFIIVTQKVPTFEPTATITSTATPTPTLLPTSTPTPTIEPTATLDEVTRVTTQYKIEAVMPWGIVVDMLNDTGLENALVLSIMAAESGGNPHLTSYAGACGLMQVIWKPWYGVSKDGLCNSNWLNIKMGISILESAIKLATDKGLEQRYGLAYYNCSVDGVHSDGCGSHGGLHYADNVLNFWLPRFQDQISWCAEQYGEEFWYNSNDVDRIGCNW
jgi:hypothetical protein